jgi:DNA-binding NarL/FixJ family response regulator
LVQNLTCPEPEGWQVHAVGSNQPRIKVLLFEDETLLADVLGIVLRADPEIEILGVHTDPSLALELAHQTQPDLVVLGCSAAPPEAVQIIAGLRTRFPELKIIVLADAFDKDSMSGSIEAGAIGYLTKGCRAEELIAAIKRAHDGEMLFSPEMLVSLLRQPRPRRLTQPLAPRELEVLRTLATGMSTDEAAGQLSITVHTVRTHLKNAMAKIGAHSKLEAIMFALKEGLLELPETEVRNGHQGR